MNSIHHEISLLITRKRRELGETQERLALKIGKSQAFINQIETNKKHPSIEHLNLIAIALNCNIHDLIPKQPIQKD